MSLTIHTLKMMPKIELHLHLDGSVKPETVMELSREQGKKLPVDKVEQLRTYMVVDEQCENLNEYLQTFDFVGQFLHTESALQRVAYELVQQCAEQQVAYVEVRFAPLLHVSEGLSIDQVYKAVIAGLQQGEKEYGVVARCIGIILRGHEQLRNLEVIQKSALYLGKGLVAVDLAGAEALYPPLLYVEEFKLATSLGIPITIHAGEAGGAQNIKDSVEVLGATRIGHGVRLREDQEIFNTIKQKRIPLEFCPISNIQTKAVESWEQYPLLEYVREGICVTVNTDNLTVSNTNLTKELWTIHQKFQLSINTLVQLQRNAAQSIFLEQPLKEHFITQFESKLTYWQLEQGGKGHEEHS